MKKTILASIIFVIVLIAGHFAFTENNDNPNTLTIIVPPGKADDFFDEVKERFPEINIDFEYYVGANASDFLRDAVNNDAAGDIIYSSQLFDKKICEEKLLDLSGYDFMGNFEDSIIRQTSFDGKVYQLLSPVNVRCVIYNQTLFDMYGWKKPENFNELLELIRQIRTDAPDVTPIAASMQTGYIFAIPSTYAQCGFLSTPAGADWEERFSRGEASIGEGFDEGLTALEKLIEADAFDPERYENVWNVNVGEFSDRRAAMEFQWSGMSTAMTLMSGVLDAETYGCGVKDDYRLMPFYGINEGDEAIGVMVGNTWALNKKLGEKGNEKKLENALKIMEYLSTQEGQKSSQINETQVPVIKNIREDQVADYMLELWKYVENGNRPFYLYTGYENIMVNVAEPIREAMVNRESAGMREKFIEIGDRVHMAEINSNGMSVTLGVVKEQFTKEETTQYVCNAVQSAGEGDFTLMTHNGFVDGILNAYGVSGRLFKGEVLQYMLTELLASRQDSIITVEMDGAKVKELLNNGKVLFNDDKTATVVFPYYWSGIDVKMKNGRVSSVKFNGRELEDTATYKVCFKNMDFVKKDFEGYIVTDTKRNVEEILGDYIKANPEVEAPEILRK